MLRQLPVIAMLQIVGFLLLSNAAPAANARLNLKIPYLTKKQQYTPLVFFKVPPGLMPEVDAMEQAVCRIERELGVKVERLDVLREPAAEACLALLTRKSPPFLYNRLTCQSFSIPAAAKPTRPSEDDDESNGSAKRNAVPVHIDMVRLRAWAKNRLLTTTTTATSNKVKPPVVAVSKDKETAMDQAELLEDMTLTQRQREGKEKIKQRTHGKKERVKK
ncbi:hypothetical protein MPSEU_000241000 [Mayamaea pseudoterrestris]|nr:hypothetical protein MPSEU_000241000 [Mayamaea pseudoterrestris]